MIKKQTQFILYPHDYDRSKGNYIELKACSWYQALKKAQAIFPNSGFSINKTNTLYYKDGSCMIRPSPRYTSSREYLCKE